MNHDTTSLALGCIQLQASERQIAERILACNETIRDYGLMLTGAQALALSQARTEALAESRRVEFGGGIIETLILALCDSPYITQENCVDTLHELIFLFYHLKNDTWDRVSDDALIDFMKTAWNGCCHGCMELLVKQGMRLAGHIHGGGTMDTFSLTEREEEEEDGDSP